MAPCTDVLVVWERDVVPHELEAWVRMQVGDIVLGAGEQIVDAQHFVAGFEQTVGEMRTEEARAAGDHHPFAHVIVASHLSPFDATLRSGLVAVSAGRQQQAERSLRRAVPI